MNAASADQINLNIDKESNSMQKGFGESEQKNPKVDSKLE